MERFRIPEKSRFVIMVYVRSCKEEFIGFIEGGSTGCQFAKIAALQQKSGKLDWVTEEMAGCPSIEKIREIYSELFRTKGNTSDCIHALLLPDVRSGVNLACITRRLLETHLFTIDNVEMYEGPLFEDPIKKTSKFLGIPLRARLANNSIGWPIFFAPLPWMSPGRRSPITALIIKPGIVKSNPTTPENQVGIDDVHLGLANHMFSRALAATRNKVPAQRGGYNNNLFRARSTLVLPQKLWNESENSF